MVSKPVLCCPMNLEQLRKMEKPTPVWLESETIEGWDGYWNRRRLWDCEWTV